MKKLKLATILGTRPEIIRMSSIIKLAEQVFDHILIHTGQNYDYSLNQVFFYEFDLREPDFYLNAVGANVGETIGNIIARSYSILSELMPDAVLILGDTNSTLAAISAKRLKIPIFHMEAGNRCFDENLPEEHNRRIVDHISDVNLPYTEQARINLISEGIKREYTFVIGSPMREVIEKCKSSNIVKKMQLNMQEYILLSLHREENIDLKQNFNELVESVNAMAEEFNMPIIYSVHPRSKKTIILRDASFHPLVKMCTPFNFSDYINLQKNAFCVVSDSGTLAEESAILGFPAVSARTSTERQEIVGSGGMVIAGINKDNILQAVKMVATFREIPQASICEYGDTNISVKVCKIIQGYTNIINRMVWRKL